MLNDFMLPKLRNCNVVGHISRVTLLRAGVVLRWVYIILVANQAMPAKLTWPFLGARHNTGDDCDHY